MLCKVRIKFLVRVLGTIVAIVAIQAVGAAGSHDNSSAMCEAELLPMLLDESNDVKVVGGKLLVGR